MKRTFEAITLFLNRSCPRNCPQCGISDNSRKPMSVGEWKTALKRLRDLLQARFFLFLGTEPLLFKEGLIELVRWFTKERLFYGFYSTSPEPLFSKYKGALVDAGLNNWSAGIDTLPGQSLDPITDKKTRESILGLQWMAAQGIQTHTLTTIHKKNLHLVPEILYWCQRNIPRVQSSLNFIEWKRSPQFDFFSEQRDMKDFCWTGEEDMEVKRRMLQIFLLSRVENMIIQTPDSYLLNAHKHYLTLDQHCQGIVGPAVDCDGTMRLCGYSTGEKVKRWNILGLTMDNLPHFLEDWEQDLKECPGCHWIFQDMLSTDTRILNPQSGFHEERWCLTRYEFEKMIREGL